MAHCPHIARCGLLEMETIPFGRIPLAARAACFGKDEISGQEIADEKQN
jgi:hypothetical protein